MISTLSNPTNVAGICVAVPSQKISNDYFLGQFSPEEIAASTKMTGVTERRFAAADVCTSDLCEFATNELLAKIGWDRDTVDALIFVSQTPDYVLPATSCVLHGKLGFKSGCIALDISLGCSGYVYGMYVASKVLDGLNVKRAVLLVGDTCSKFVSPFDKSTAMLFGDAGSCTALEFDSTAPRLPFTLGSDGNGAQNLLIKSGQYRHPSSSETLKLQKGSDGYLRREEDLYMNGSEIFNFTITSVPKLVKTFLEAQGKEIDDFSGFVFHQANQFMIKHIAAKLKIPLEKVPISINQFGNTSSASIPLTLVTNNVKSGVGLATYCIAGFGVGYSFACSQVTLEDSNLSLVEFRK